MINEYQNQYCGFSSYSNYSQAHAGRPLERSCDPVSSLGDLSDYIIEQNKNYRHY